MALVNVRALQFMNCDFFGNRSKAFTFLPLQTTNFQAMTVMASKRANTKTESAKTINIRRRKKLYAMLVDDQNKKCLFYGSTLQKSLRGSPPCSKIFCSQEAAKCLGEELVKACVDLDVNEISSYDRNGFPRGERMQAFELAISRHGFLPR
ncbi:50S ribosomal protein L18 isoform X3 [Ricinus communis]|uniref:50S ribosomal protein L18 isoform X3 n=1 Tax=Ricinus communis TaxID=3988 RepID=UPI00201AB0CB|nr:50S ribosomal protein L18 isoform X3 [Ricinus communis]